MSTRGKPRTKDGSSGRHDYSGEQSLSFWQRRWREQILAQPEARRQETIARAERLMRETRYRSALHDLAVCYSGLGDDDDRMGE